MKLTDHQQSQLTELRKLAGQVNRVIRHFAFDGDMVKRWQEGRPNKEDIKLVADTLHSAGDQLAELATVEFQPLD